MALFESKDEKLARQEAKQEAKVDALLERYGLEDIKNPDTFEALKTISYTLSGNKFTEVGAALGGNAIDVAKMTYLRALIEQNFIIIKQLDNLSK